MKRRIRNILPSRKTLALITLLAITGGTLLYIRPSHIAIIAGFGVVLSALIYLICSYFLSRRDSIIAAIFVLLFLVATFLSGFNVLNTIFLLCFIIGIKVLLR